MIHYIAISCLYKVDIFHLYLSLFVFQLDVAYEGDVSSSVGTTSSSSDKSTDLYDFDEANEEDLCLVLFPESSKSKSGSKTKSTKKKTSQKPAGRLTSSTKKQEPIQRSSSRCSDRKCSLRDTVKSPTSATTKKQDSTKKGPGLKQADPNIKQAKPTVEGKNENSRPVRSSAKKRKPDSPTQTPELRKKSHRENTNPVEVSMFDSGVFVSPIEKVTNSSLTTPDITPIPTPSLSISQVSLDRDLSPIQFDSLLEESLSLSPVKAQELLTSPAKRPRTEPMDVGSPQLRTSIVGKSNMKKRSVNLRFKLKKKKNFASEERVDVTFLFLKYCVNYIFISSLCRPGVFL